MSFRGALRKLTPAGWIVVVSGIGIAAALLAAAFVGGGR